MVYCGLPEVGTKLSQSGKTIFIKVHSQYELIVLVN